MNDFDFYLKEGKVKKQKPDLELAKSLLNDANDRFAKMTQLNVENFSKIIFENIYDAIRAVLDALLAANGYKSYSHEASIIYLQKYEVGYSILTELDDFRYKKNSSKYYGKEISSEDALAIISFYNNYSELLIKIVKNKVK